jgi:hypothetical protein
VYVHFFRFTDPVLGAYLTFVCLFSGADEILVSGPHLTDNPVVRHSHGIVNVTSWGEWVVRRTNGFVLI